ncbi:MAG: hypothetical protein LBI95_01930 [Holosporales bacterium]|jgi:hypothetical protein|nr:hypothetical protein [Holosporales bacterium]
MVQDFKPIVPRGTFYVCDDSEKLPSKVKQNLGSSTIIKLYLYTFKKLL